MRLKEKLETLPIDPADLPRLIELPVDAPVYERDREADGTLVVREWTNTRKVRLSRETEARDTFEGALVEFVQALPASTLKTAMVGMTLAQREAFVTRLYESIKDASLLKTTN